MPKPTGAKLEAALERQAANRAASVQRQQEKQRNQAKQSPAGGRSGGSKKRRNRLPEKNQKRQAEKKPKQFAAQAALCRGLPCCVTFPELYDEEMRAMEHYTDARRVSAPHHSPTVANGGLDYDTAPVLDSLHDEVHTRGEETVLREHGLPADWFRVVAARLHEEIRHNREQR